ncbi:MAG: primosomal protein N' [Armatimonadetes bacterium]|nr:primosomal protein N' [Armatimonadota bacterium]
MRIVVAFDSGVPESANLLTYAVPERLQSEAKIGAVAHVPLRSGSSLGVIVDAIAEPPATTDRPAFDLFPFVSAELVELARNLQQETFCSFRTALYTVVPPISMAKLVEYIKIKENAVIKGKNQQKLAEAIGPSWRAVSMEEIKKLLPAGIYRPAIRSLADNGSLIRKSRLEVSEVKYRRFVIELIGTPDEIQTLLSRPLTGAPTGRIIARLAVSPSESMARAELLEEADAGNGTLIRLEKAGIVRSRWEGDDIEPKEAPIRLNALQKAVVTDLSRQIASGQHAERLIYGITGSGKTEVYLRAIAEAQKLGRNAIVLTPEIGLSARLFEAVRERFGPRVATIHSQLARQERLRQWNKCRTGEVSIAVGPRSAVFAPFETIGLIVVDEEHDSGYKQRNSPTYSAIQVARARARRHGATLVLGSATPSIESFFKHKEALLRLDERAAGGELPSGEIVDMRGQGSLISRELLAALKDTIGKGEQALLVLNRRGYGRALACQDCGHALKCDYCASTLVYHRSPEQMKCHICGRKSERPKQCPSCGGPNLKTHGAGSQKLLEKVSELLPNASVARLDGDIGPVEYLETVRKFLMQKTDVLVGTQVISKGLDAANVGLVGVVSADSSLNMPDFRSSERTFQLLMQAAGRAGRRKGGSRAIFQALAPDHPAVVCAAQHDYDAFYAQEIENRRELNYPPFSRLVRVVAQSPEEALASRACRSAAKNLSENLDVLGPAPAPIERADGLYRYHALVRLQPDAQPWEALSPILDALPDEARKLITVDVDPTDLM